MMSSGAQLFGSIGNAALEGAALDIGQVMSANNMFPSLSKLQIASAAVGGVSSGIEGIGNLISNHASWRAQYKNLDAQIQATKKYRDRYLTQYDRATEQLEASQIVGYLSTGLMLDSGTPEVVMNETARQRGLERDWTKSNFDMEIRNLQAAKRATKKAGVLSDVFGAISLPANVASNALKFLR